MSDHGRDHWGSFEVAKTTGAALKWLLRYLRGADDYGILFRDDASYKGGILLGFYDSDFAGNIDTSKSQTWYIFTMYGSVVS